LKPCPFGICWLNRIKCGLYTIHEHIRDDGDENRVIPNRVKSEVEFKNLKQIRALS